jgi:hypothetical protein
MPDMLRDTVQKEQFMFRGLLPEGSHDVQKPQRRKQSEVLNLDSPTLQRIGAVGVFRDGKF